MASAGSYDQVAVDGTLAFGGALQVSLLSGYSPAADTKFSVFDWGNATGQFSSISLPALGSGLAWSTAGLYTSGNLVVANVNALPGDYNRDGRIDAGDISAMQTALTDLSGFAAANSSLSAGDLLTLEDVNGDGVVTNADEQALLRFLLNGGNNYTTVPEPTSGVLLALAGAAICAARWRAKRRDERVLLQRIKFGCAEIALQLFAKEIAEARFLLLSPVAVCILCPKGQIAGNSLAEWARDTLGSARHEI